MSGCFCLTEDPEADGEQTSISLEQDEDAFV